VSHTPSSHADLRAALADSLERLCRYHQALGTLFPNVAEGTRYQLTENDNWLTGFWTGLLCLVYAETSLHTSSLVALLPRDPARGPGAPALRDLSRAQGLGVEAYFMGG
jgi:hypothetical protein